MQQVVARVQSNPNVSSTQRRELGLSVRDGTNTPATLPAAAPSVVAMITGPDSLRVVARDPADPDRRAKPAGVDALLVMTHLGATPPSNPALWPTTQVSGRTTVDLIWPGMASATDVWVSCCWVSTRKQRGPASAPACVRLGGTIVPTAATSASSGATDTPAMRIAA